MPHRNDIPVADGRQSYYREVSRAERLFRMSTSARQQQRGPARRTSHPHSPSHSRVPRINYNNDDHEHNNIPPTLTSAGVPRVKSSQQQRRRQQRSPCHRRHRHDGVSPLHRAPTTHRCRDRSRTIHTRPIVRGTPAHKVITWSSYIHRVVIMWLSYSHQVVISWLSHGHHVVIA